MLKMEGYLRQACQARVHRMVLATFAIDPTL
jgi:hypothetical protein